MTSMPRMKEFSMKRTLKKYERTGSLPPVFESTDYFKPFYAREALLKENIERFQRIGFEIEPFGGEEYAVRAVPDNLFGIAKKDCCWKC